MLLVNSFAIVAEKALNSLELHYPDILDQSKPSFYSDCLLYVQVASKKDFNDCTGFEESDEGESGPVTVSFDKVFRHHIYDSLIIMIL